MRDTVAPVQSFGEFVKTKRLLLRLSQREVASEAGINQAYLSRVENGEREPTITVALKLCDVLKLNINDFASEFL